MCVCVCERALTCIPKARRRVGEESIIYVYTRTLVDVCVSRRWGGGGEDATAASGLCVCVCCVMAAAVRRRREPGADIRTAAATRERERAGGRR